MQRDDRVVLECRLLYQYEDRVICWGGGVTELWLSLNLLKSPNLGKPHSGHCLNKKWA